MLTNEEIEQKMIKKLVLNCSHLLSANLIGKKIIKSEKPDFIIHYDTHNVGVEITQAIDQSLLKTAKINANCDDPISYSSNNFEGKNMGSKETKETLKKENDKLVSIPYEGDELTQNTLTLIQNSIEMKNEKFHNYRKFEKNVLLIYAEKRPFVDIKIIGKEISLYLSKNTSQFDLLFLEIGNYIIAFTENDVIYFNET